MDVSQTIVTFIPDLQRNIGCCYFTVSNAQVPPKRISYFKLFVYTLFPPAALLLGLLLFPFPTRVAKAVIQLCDSFLFLQPHPLIPLSLFWLVLGASALTFFIHLDEMNQLHKQYRGREFGGTFEDRDRLLIKLLAEERNCWISGCCLALWIGVHRYRSLLKKFYRLDDERQKRLQDMTIAQVAPTIPVAELPKQDPVVKKAQ